METSLVSTISSILVEWEEVEELGKAEIWIHDGVLIDLIIKKHQIKAVFHFASYLQVGESVTNPLKYYENNIGGGTQLIKACVNGGVNYFIFSSSCACFGEPQYLPLDENHPKNPINPYGMTKFILETILRDVSAVNKDFLHVNLRYFNVAGAYPEHGIGPIHFPESLLMSATMDAALGKKPHFKIFGSDYPTPDGTAIRDYIHMDDLCAAHELAYVYLKKHGKSDSFNLGTGNGFLSRDSFSCWRKVVIEPGLMRK